MPISPRKLYCCTIVGELHGQQVMTRFWIRGGDASPASTVTAEITNIRAGMFTNILPAYKACLTSAWHGNHMTTMEMTTRPRVMIDEVIAVSGDQDADALPSFCAAVLSYRTGFSGRSYAGRVYLPGLYAGSSESSRLVGGAFGLVQSLGATLLSTFGPTGTNTYGRVGVFSRLAGVTRSAGPPPVLNYSILGWTQITQYIARADVGTQRKRKLGVGQ